MSDHLTLTNMIELANHLSNSLTNEYSDICDIDFMIEELNHKKKAIAKRMEKDALNLRTILNNSYFKDNVTESARNAFAEALDGIDDLVTIQLANISA